MQDHVVYFPNIQNWMLSLVKHQLLPGNSDVFLTSLQLGADLQTSVSQIYFILP